MDEKKAKTGKTVGWICLGVSIVSLAIFILKSAAGRDASPALVVIAMMLMITGGIGLARAQRVSQK
jgi:hypothetical protein